MSKKESGLDRETEIQFEIEKLEKELKTIAKAKDEFKQLTEFSSEDKVKIFDRIHEICLSQCTPLLIEGNVLTFSSNEITEEIIGLCLGESIEVKVAKYLVEVSKQ
jgi:hypothetical protein